jgi:hypothetical protein
VGFKLPHGTRLDQQADFVVEIGRVVDALYPGGVRRARVRERREPDNSRQQNQGEHMPWKEGLLEDPILLHRRAPDKVGRSGQWANRMVSLGGSQADSSLDGCCSLVPVEKPENQQFPCDAWQIRIKSRV